MMNSRAAVVGGFILGALALVAAGIVFFGGRNMFARHTRAVAFFTESVAGLNVGSPVTFHGVRVGTVQGIVIHYDPDTMTAQIPVYLELTDDELIWEGKRSTGAVMDFKRLIAAGLRAQLQLESFVTGQLRVDLDFWPGSPARLIGSVKNVPEIPTVTSGLSRLQTELTQLPLSELANTADRAFASLARVSEHLDAVVDPVTRSAQRTTDAATRTLQTTDRAVSQVQVDASTALHHLDALLIDARHQLGARSDDLGRTLTDTDRAARRAQTLLDSLNGLAEPRADFREDLEATIRDLSAAASSLRNFAATIERHPNAVLVGRASP